VVAEFAAKLGAGARGWRSQGNGEFRRWVVAVGGEVQRGKRGFRAARGFIHVTKSVLRMRTPWRGQAGKQLRAGRVAARDAARPPAACSASPPLAGAL